MIMLIIIVYCSDDGIVISISIWQCLVEFCTNFLIIGSLFIFKEHNYNLLEFLLLIAGCLNYVIFPSFYLLADSRFRNAFYQKGRFKALCSALKQNYEKNSNELEMQVMSWNIIVNKHVALSCRYFCDNVCTFWNTAFKKMSYI